MSIFGEPISVYTRAQAIEDGVLVDVTKTAKEAGFRFNTCLSSAVWSDLNDKLANGESAEGRLWDVLMVAKVAAKSGTGDRVYFQVKIGRQIESYYMHIGPGDTPHPVMTIMREGED